MPSHYVIVGKGAAGLAVAEAIRGQDPAGYALVSEDPHGYYSRPGLAYYPTGKVPERMLHPFSYGDFTLLSPRLVRARVAHLDPAAHRVEFDTDESLACDRLLLAAGARATAALAPGADLGAWSSRTTWRTRAAF